MPQSIKIQDARIWDGHGESYLQADQLIMEDGRIAAIGNDLPSTDVVIPLGGKALLPGFIDAHFHAYAADVNVPRLEKLPISYLAHHARQSLEAALKRGFTTVRDAGGADWGLWKASEEGLFASPRIFYAGRALSQTGGHGDSRDASFDPCGCRHKAILAEVADGVDEVRKAARETLRRGAHQIKIFVSGGVSSPTDPIWMPQFSPEEIRAIVDEARSRRTYVMAHAYTADAVIHAVANGVRSIEHGNLIDEAAAELMAENSAFLVPTLIVYDSLTRRGRDLGLPESAYPKLAEVAAHGLKAIEIARKKGVQIGFGTDLLGPLQDDQLLEFKLRSAVEKPVDTLRSATSVNARLIGQEGKLGTVAVGALADLVAFDGDPLSDLGCVYGDGPTLVVSRGTAV
jgi:imidazolonepropionase-like amidohydrolase